MKSLVVSILFTLFTLNSVAAMAAMSPELLELSEAWAVIKYRLPEEKRVKALEALNSEAEALREANPGSAEPMVWQAIILSTLAGEKGGGGRLVTGQAGKKATRTGIGCSFPGKSADCRRRSQGGD